MRLLLLRDRESISISDALNRLLINAGHEVQLKTLNRGELKPCLGCFGCWVKTPGLCVITDDTANEIARAEMGADAVILFSSITFGGFSADIKAFLDRSIQNILPFFETYQGEMHHAMRYERFPIWIPIGHGDVSEEERRTFLQLAERNALNMRPSKFLALTLKDDSELKQVSPAIFRTLEANP